MAKWAMVKLEQALQIYNRFLGKDHPERRAAISWLESAREEAKQASSKKPSCQSKVRRQGWGRTPYQKISKIKIFSSGKLRSFRS